jgi:hypothetical protein
MPDSGVVRRLAAALLAGEQERRAIAERITEVLGAPRPWARRLAAKYVDFVQGRTRPRQDDVVAFLLRRGDFGISLFR